MGMFMASVSFRCAENADWEGIKPEIVNLFQGLDGLVSNLDSNGPGYVILSPYGDMGMFLADLPGKISALTGDFSVMATCVDSDFALLELYRAGELLEKSYIGQLFEEYEFLADFSRPNPELWMPLLRDPTQADALSEALFKEEVLAEENLRKLSALTGLSIFDDEMIFADN